jgi:hypothetical protein
VHRFASDANRRSVACRRRFRCSAEITRNRSTTCPSPGDLFIEVLDAGGKVLCVSNPLRIAEPPLPECRAMVDGGASKQLVGVAFAPTI